MIYPPRQPTKESESARKCDQDPGWIETIAHLQAVSLGISIAGFILMSWWLPRLHKVLEAVLVLLQGACKRMTMILLQPGNSKALATGDKRILRATQARINGGGMNSSPLDLDERQVCLFAPLDLATDPDGITPEKIGIYKMRHDGSWWLVATVDLWGNNQAEAGFIPVFKVAILGQRDQSNVEAFP